MTRRLMVGVVLPLLMWAGIVWLRASWTYDIHPWQPIWIAWVVSMSAGSFAAGIGFHSYWFARQCSLRPDEVAKAVEKLHGRLQVKIQEVPDAPPE